MKKRKAIIMAVVFLVVVVVTNAILNFILVQPGLSRTILHEAAEGNYDTVFLGASHGSYGLNPDILDEEMDQETMNLCMGGEYMRDAYYVLKYAIKNNDLENVVLDIDYQYLVNYHKEGILHNNIYNAYPDGLDKVSYYVDKIMTEDYRGTFLKWTNYWQCYYMVNTTIAKKTSDEYKNYDASVVSMNANDTYMGRGFISRSRNAKKDSTGAVSWNESKVSSSEVGFIEKIAQLCEENDINLIFTTITVDPSTISENTSNYSESHAYIEELAEELDVDYYDFNYLKFDYFERDTSDFYDKEGHMYGDTAEEFSAIYGSVLKQAMDGTLDTSEYFETDLKTMYQNL